MFGGDYMDFYVYFIMLIKELIFAFKIYRYSVSFTDFYNCEKCYINFKMQ